MTLLSQQPLHAAQPGLAKGLANGGQRRGEPRAVGGIVKPYHRELARHGNAFFGAGTHHAERHLIVCHQNRLRERGAGQQLMAFLVARGSAPVALGDGAGLYPSRLQSGQPARKTGTRRNGTSWPTEQGDPLMAQRQQMMRAERCALFGIKHQAVHPGGGRDIKK
ncbi:hypothetical protein D3C76_1317240 [compost metagenome]